jgi:hypothetical protein
LVSRITLRSADRPDEAAIDSRTLR